MLFWIGLVFAIAIAIGVWRKFGAIQWIWLMFGVTIAILVVWLIMVVFVIGPEMVRRGPPGSQ